MALHPTGSDKILEVQTESISIVIKSKKSKSFIDSGVIDFQASTLMLLASDLKTVRVFPCNIDEEYDSPAANIELKVPPLFFEQTDYEIIIESNDGKKISCWHENSGIRNKITGVTDKNPGLLTGIVNFGNHIGYSDFEIRHGENSTLILRIEVYPTKISYKEDYRLMLEDISDEVYSAVIDFMKKTYDWIKISKDGDKSPAIFFQIISSIYEKYIKAAKMIINVPHHKLEAEHRIIPAHKVRRTDSASEKWLIKHPEYLQRCANGIVASKVFAVRKQITYDTLENQFAKFILNSTVKQLREFLKRYCKPGEEGGRADPDIVKKAEAMISEIKNIMSTSFLENVSDYKSSNSMSLVFEMAPGYRELYKYFIILNSGLALNGDVFRTSMKDTALLYEYWCFIKLVSILKKQGYRLTTDDVIKVDRSGVTVTLVKGYKSKVKFKNLRTGEEIALTYNPAERSLPTVSQKPDNVLTLTKNGTSTKYKYVFDAKYRIETHPEQNSYPDENIGPKLDDINTMHRYRDSIVYESGETSRFVFKKEMFGAYILFPYAKEDEYEKHHFYKSINKVNIGGLPFLPGATRLVEKMLDELISDSDESAFERASLPVGVEERLVQVKWDKRDVLVGSFGSKEQFSFNLKNKNYYVPVKYLDINKLPVHYVAMYQSARMFGEEAGIRYYGEVYQITRIKREKIKIPVTRGNEDEYYYLFKVKEWKTLSEKITVKDEGVYEPKFTNIFLLENCKQSFELFHIHTGEQFRLLYELKRIFSNTSVGMNEKSEPIYQIEGGKKIWVHDGYFDIFSENGEKIFTPPLSISDFSSHPRYYFNKIAEKLTNSTKGRNKLLDSALASEMPERTQKQYP